MTVAEPQPEHAARRADSARGGATPDRPVESDSPVPVGRMRGPTTTRAATALQRQAGNRAVSRLIATPSRTRSPASGGPAPADTLATGVQRLADGEARPAEPAADPKFAALTRDVVAKRKALTGHPPPESVAGAAQSAAVAPPDDQQARGKAAQAETMNAAKPGEFNKAAFVAAVNQAVLAQAPKNLDEADKFQPDDIRGHVTGPMTDAKKTSAGAIETATKAPPPVVGDAKKVTPLPPARSPATPAAPDPSRAVPDPLPPAATDFSAGPRQVDQEMAEAGVTEPQLRSDEEFAPALAAKREAEEHSAAAPPAVRAGETATLTAAKAQARMTGTAAMTAMTGVRARGDADVRQGQQGTKSADEKRRAEATARLQKVFDATKTEVESILTGLDKTVDEQFTREEKQARDAFTAEHQQKMDEYKDRRYSGFWGKGRWLKDKFAGLPEEANQIFVVARTGYVNRMQGVISRIADTIGAALGRAKARIAQGRNELQAEVKKLPADLQQFGREAAADFAGRFDELTESVEATSQELVQALASKYTEAMKAVDAEIDAEKEANKGIVAKAVDAVKGAVKTIMALKELLMNVLAKAATAVAAIIKDPIGFLGRLVSAVGSGLKSFLDNIADHLKNGLVGWLMGTMSSAGLQMPAKFDLKGIIGMIASLLGLTWGAIRGRIVSRGVPDQAVTAVEESEPLAQKLKGEGVAGVWETIVERVGDLKEKLLGQLSKYLIPTVLIAGITWLISLLNPASAFIKAVKMIVDFITFIVERGAQIAAFVNSVLDAVIAIAGGGGGGVGALIEKALATSIPVLIGALAAFLGIGGLANKVKAFFQSLSRPVMKAVDWVVDKLVAFGRKIWGKLKSGAGKLKDRVVGGPGARDQGSAEKQPTSTTEKSAGPAREVVVPFTMNGAAHRLIVPAGGRALVMASTPSLLAGKARAAIARLESAMERRPQTAASEAERQRLEDLRKILNQAIDLDRLIAAGKTPPEALESRMGALRTLIVDYGSTYRTRELDVDRGWPTFDGAEGVKATLLENGQGEDQAKAIMWNLDSAENVDILNELRARTFNHCVGFSRILSDLAAPRKIHSVRMAFQVGKRLLPQRIGFEMPGAGDVDLAILDVAGNPQVAYQLKHIGINQLAPRLNHAIDVQLAPVPAGVRKVVVVHFDDVTGVEYTDSAEHEGKRAMVNRLRALNPDIEFRIRGSDQSP